PHPHAGRVGTQTWVKSTGGPGLPRWRVTMVRARGGDVTAATLLEDEASTEDRRLARPRLLLQRAAAAVRDPVVAAMVGMLAVWSATFIVLGWMRHDHFATFGFDLGIYDQGIWLLSRFKDPFITIRGLEFFGHHMNPALLLFVPAYWLGAGPHFLLVAQVLAQASGAFAIYLLARDRLADRFALATRVLIPWANGIGPFYESFFGEFGKNPGQIVGNVITHPGKALSVATREDRLNYYRMMFAPVAFLPLAALPTLAIAAPMLGINALSSFPYQREIRYHYASLVLAGIMVATVEAVAFLGRAPGLRRFLVG